ncbi:class I SAM-dependent methyltransferase [Amycolatopsis azurea]|uniref:SAM-dependent methyltransferase n=1 Tax=Amycolatopsis azurea DSM 43854 TaxID=1238180 RepID=M2QE27_9PSEU|nr:class I SAM-dependent methyltransferase [Amycolatopsis azurea]EMD24986.1 Ubiquinone/menaquinone biosynthesis methyltransferase UbiE [Amycolatopsis azurea DSM 43854]OOC05260.1 SAM-dependent methyltransferase [Amycolatopsis azurea DSM 43854]
MSNIKDRKRFKLLPEMGGALARSYARQRGTEPQIDICRKQARELTADLPEDAKILEVAFGPGYFAVELARLGFSVTGLDVAPTFVEIASEYARAQGVEASFREGDVAAMPFDDESFDVVVCQAAFKNFVWPVKSLDEMYRVLRPGGTAVVQDMNRNATDGEIAREVEGMKIGKLAGLGVRQALVGLRRRAYTPVDFSGLVAETAFRTCEVTTVGIGVDVRLKRG